jgi:hypothetical protein
MMIKTHRTSAPLPLYPPSILWGHLGLNLGLHAEELASNHMAQPLNIMYPLYYISKPQATVSSYTYTELYFFVVLFLLIFMFFLFCTFSIIHYEIFHTSSKHAAYRDEMLESRNRGVIS